eukprot:6203464-Pyramimonas_sp.AAC.1
MNHLIPLKICPVASPNFVRCRNAREIPFPVGRHVTHLADGLYMRQGGPGRAALEAAGGVAARGGADADVRAQPAAAFAVVAALLPAEQRCPPRVPDGRHRHAARHHVRRRQRAEAAPASAGAGERRRRRHVRGGGLRGGGMRVSAQK